MSTKTHLTGAAARNRRVTPDERRQVVEALRGGESAYSVAKRTGFASSTISRIAGAEGVSLEQCATQKAVAARLTRDEAAARFDEARQLEYISRYIEAAAMRLDTVHERPLTQLEAQQGATALGILIDKWRLIQGEATARTEVANSGARERLAARLDELAKRRQQAEVVVSKDEQSERVAV